MKKSGVGFIRDGKLEPLSKRNYDFALQSFEDGTKITWTIENYRRAISLSQMSYVHKIFHWIGEYTGEDPKQIKEALKARFGIRESLKNKNGEEVCDDNGEVMEKLKSLSEYNTEETSALIEKIRMWASDFLGYEIPDADRYRNNNIKF